MSTDDHATVPSLGHLILLDEQSAAHATEHPQLRQFLQSAAGIRIVAETRASLEAVDCTQTPQPEVLLLESALAEPDTRAFVARITQAFPHLRVIRLSAYQPERAIALVVRNVEQAYVFQETTSYAREAASHLIADPVAVSGTANTPAAVPPSLTPRQQDVLRLIVQGLTTKEIAQRLQRSTKTVEAHRRQMMQRLGVHNVAELVRDAIQHNLYTPGT